MSECDLSASCSEWRAYARTAVAELSLYIDVLWVVIILLACVVVWLAVLVWHRRRSVTQADDRPRIELPKLTVVPCEHDREINALRTEIVALREEVAHARQTTLYIGDGRPLPPICKK